MSNDDAEFKHLPARTAGEAGLEGDVAIENTAAGCGGEGGAGADGPAAPSGLEEDGLRQRREAREADSREEGTPRVRGREKEEERNARQKEERALRFFNFSLHTHTPVHTQHACFAHTLPARATPHARCACAHSPHAQHINTWVVHRRKHLSSTYRSSFPGAQDPAAEKLTEREDHFLEVAVTEIFKVSSPYACACRCLFMYPDVCARLILVFEFFVVMCSERSWSGPGKRRELRCENRGDR